MSQEIVMKHVVEAKPDVGIGPEGDVWIVSIVSARQLFLTGP